MIIYRLTMFVIGLVLATTGMIFFVLYISLLNYGLTIGEFIVYILKTQEFYLLPFGVFLMFLSLFGKKFWTVIQKLREGRQHRERVLK